MTPADPPEIAGPLPARTTSRFRRWLRNAIIASLVAHVTVGIIAGFIVAFRHVQKPPVQFESPPPVRPSLAPRKMEMRVKVQDLSRRSARPRLQPRLVAMAPSQLALPEIKNDIQAQRNKVARDVSALGASGFGAGIGGGFGDGFGGGLGGGLPFLMADRCSAADRAKRLTMSGGRLEADMAVSKGLMWLKAHQNPNGSWGSQHPYAMTGLALLAFLGHCETPESPAFGLTVRKGIEYLVAEGQKHKGHFNSGGNAGVYNHAIATYALAEAYTMTHIGHIVPVLQQAVAQILREQNGRGGWSYSGPGTSDTSVTGWMVQALKAAHLTSLKIDGLTEALNKAVHDVKSLQAGDGDWKYRNDSGGSHPSLTGVGVLCLQFWKNGDSPQAHRGLKQIAASARGLKYDNASLYEWYYSTQAAFQGGGETWTKWNGAFQDEILSHQDGDGSWKAEGKGLTDKQGGQDGKTYRTCLCILMLEVYYRYLPSTM